MSMSFLRILCWIMPVIALSGCVKMQQPMPKVRYYTLEYSAPSFDRSTSLPLVVELEPFGARAQYNTNRMVYRDGPFRRDAYLYAKWRDTPGDMVTYFLGRDLKASRLFSAVVTEPMGVYPPYIIKGRVDDFFEWNGKESWSAVLSLDVTLISRSGAGGERILLQKSYQVEEPCERKNPQGLAEAMSRAMSEVSRRMILDIHDQLTGVKSTHE
jgi:ABC-type uncharacterized transport system auxiliary subunit